jgi:glycosyltransferase involved in cell wall biosynthesis
MIIAIDGSRAFLKRRTGIEEYSYQVIKHLRDELTDAQVVLYIRADQEVDFELPHNWRAKKLWAPRLWTQIRLSLEVFLHRPDVLLVPAHTVPLIHPANTVVVIHGLEYEFCPESYSWWSRVSMRTAIKFSCRVARTVVCVSENTKRDVMKLYGTSAEKIKVIYEGYDNLVNSQQLIVNGNTEIFQNVEKINDQDFFQDHLRTRSGRKKILEHLFLQPYILFIGRLEERKNIVRFIESFEFLKKKYNIKHKLVLVGKPGFGYEKIHNTIANSMYKNDIIELGYVSEEEKWALLKNADIFLFATLYEGFGIPVLEAQSVGVPVITSNTSSLPEVAGEGALLVNPESVEEIAKETHKFISDNELKSDIIHKGVENAKRFSWRKCTQEIGVCLKR